VGCWRWRLRSGQCWGLGPLPPLHQHPSRTSRINLPLCSAWLCLSAGAKDPSNFSYTIAAARRSEQRKLLCFVKLADFVICDTLHNLLLDSERDLLAFSRPEPSPVQELTEEDREAMAAMSAAERKEAEEAYAASLPVPLCEVQVRVDRRRRLRFKWFNTESRDSPNESHASPPDGSPPAFKGRCAAMRRRWMRKRARRFPQSG